MSVVMFVGKTFVCVSHYYLMIHLFTHCKGLFTRTVPVPVSVKATVKVENCVNVDEPFDG